MDVVKKTKNRQIYLNVSFLHFDTVFNTQPTALNEMSEEERLFVKSEIGMSKQQQKCFRLTKQ